MKLLGYQNLNRAFYNYSLIQLFVGICMDNRKHLQIPVNYVYINWPKRASKFKVPFAISARKVGHKALIGRYQCGMFNLAPKKNGFIAGAK